MSATDAEALPAWGWQFVPGAIAPQPSVLAGRIDRASAFGDGLGRGVRVAIVDSGVDASHPAVARVAGYADVRTSEPDGGIVVDTAPHEDLFGHGTACAGIIRSIAPEVELFSVRVLGRDLRGKARIFAAGLEWAVANDMQVINLSLSTYNEAFVRRFHDLCDAASFRGSVVVSALSNFPGPSYPSQFAAVCSTAAVDHGDTETWWCRSGGPAEFGAAGVAVRVAWLDGASITASGNSFAAPVIAGHAARVIAANPGITPLEVKAVLRAFARNACSVGADE